MKHVQGSVCGSCNEKLEEVHPELLFWFEWVKTQHEDAHVCWGFRGEKDQNDAFEKGLSKLQWPNSKHNHLDVDGRPLSLALDIFQLANDGSAHFDHDWYNQIWNETLEKDSPIEWGGNFEHLKDLDHFQLKENV